MLIPKDYYRTYTSEQMWEWRKKDYEERQKIALESYLPEFVNENNELDILKLVERILYLQERVDELENTCERMNND
jgi:hypothetical protein